MEFVLEEESNVKKCNQCMKPTRRVLSLFNTPICSKECAERDWKDFEEELKILDQRIISGTL